MSNVFIQTSDNKTLVFLSPEGWVNTYFVACNKSIQAKVGVIFYVRTPKFETIRKLLLQIAILKQ